MTDVGKLVREIQSSVLDGGPPSVEQVRRVLGWSQASLDEAWGRWSRIMAASEGADNNTKQIGNDLIRTANLFDYYADQLAELGKPDADEDQQKALYERVTAPLIGGYCYGPPSCSQANIDSFGSPFAIAPRFVEPFKIQNALDTATEAGSENLQLLFEDLKKGAAKVGETGLDLGKLALVGAGVFVASKLLD